MVRNDSSSNKDIYERAIKSICEYYCFWISVVVSYSIHSITDVNQKFIEYSGHGCVGNICIAIFWDYTQYYSYG